MGGIIPNKEAGITPGLLFPVTFPGGTTYNLSDPTTFGGLTERLGWRNQPNVVEFLKAEVKQFPEWVGAANSVFEGLRRGVPGGENVPLPLAIVESLASQITGLPPGTWATINEVTADLSALPGVAQVIALLTNLPSVAITDAVTILGSYGTNLNAFLGATNFTSPTFSVTAAATAFVNLVLAPLNLLPILVGGFIPALNIPGLDASKIVSGAFAAPLLQSLIDAISQGFGGGTGLGFSALHTLLSGLPTAQGLADAVAAGLGHLAGGYTPANITSFLGTIPGGNIASTLLASVIPGLDVSKIVSGTFGTGFIPNLPAGQITSGVFGTGLIPGLDASKIISGAFAQSLIPNLTSAWGGTIANAKVIGTVSADIGTDISQLIAAVTTGAGNSSIPGTLANLQAQLGGISSLLGYRPASDPPATSTSGIAQTQAAFTAMRSATRPTFLALADSTGDVTFPFPLAGTSATTIPVTQAVPAIGSIGTTDGGVAGTSTATWPLKKSISFCGSKSGTINAMYLNVYRVNTVTGETTWVHSSPNIVASVPSAMNRVYYNMANVVDYVPVGQNEYYQIGLAILGPGTYNLVGIPNSWAPANAVGFPTHIGASRTPVTNLASVISLSPTNTKNPSWNITTVAGDNCIVVDLAAFSSTTAITAVSVTCGGVAMTAKDPVATYLTGGRAYLLQFELHNAAFANFTPGSQAIVVTTTGGGTSGTQCIVQGVAVSYQNISAVGSAVTTTGNSTNPTQTVTGLTANSATIIHSALGADVGSFSASNQNLIANVAGTGVSENLLVQDQLAYATSVPFTGTDATSGFWGASAFTLTSTLATLVAPASVPAPGFTPSSNLPWFMFGGTPGVSGSAVASHAPNLATIPGSDSYTKKSWAKHYDIIICSAGGGAANGFSFSGGAAGSPGSWVGYTVDAADIGAGAWTITGGEGGLGGSGGVTVGDPGFDGGSPTVDIPGVGTLYGEAGGAGGYAPTASGAGDVGIGADDFDYNGEPYYGGGGGGSPQASGGQPGGSGAGGNSSFSGAYVFGGNGGDGIVYILAYQ